MGVYKVNITNMPEYFITLAMYPNSGNSYCTMHNQMAPADADCYYCLDQRRCPHTPSSCDFYPANPGPSIAMYEEIREHINAAHPLNKDTEWLNQMIDSQIRHLYLYYD